MKEHTQLLPARANAARLINPITHNLYRKLYYQAKIELSDKDGWNQQDLSEPIPEDESVDA